MLLIDWNLGKVLHLFKIYNKKCCSSRVTESSTMIYRRRLGRINGMYILCYSYLCTCTPYLLNYIHGITQLINLCSNPVNSYCIGCISDWASVPKHWLTLRSITIPYYSIFNTVMFQIYHKPWLRKWVIAITRNYFEQKRLAEKGYWVSS